MSTIMVQERLLSYQCQTVLEQENALKEIAQEIALSALARTDFFKVAAFQGGTCLRILYGLERFSEDLDFVLEQADKKFDWQPYVQEMRAEFKAYGYDLDVENRSKAEKIIKTVFLKADSVGGMLVIKDLRTNKAKLKIKLEIDTHPPAGSNYALKYLDFPLPFQVNSQDLPSLFASKCHALLCREYIKGRDWYDFNWYVTRQTPINLNLLGNAIAQTGPWQNGRNKITNQWLLQKLKLKIKEIDWQAAKQDVARFLKPREVSSLNVWSKEFFLDRVEKLAHYLAE